MSATQIIEPGTKPKYPWLPYVAPFVVFIAFLALDKPFSAHIAALYPIRVAVVLAVLIVFSRHVIDFKVNNALGSILLGVAVFVIWVGPDVLWPSYRSHWLFTNSITGGVQSTAPEA